MSNRKNPVRFAVDFANRQIIATEASLDRAKRYGSMEYNELCKLMSAHPQFSIVKKAVEQSARKKTYKHLSFAFMEDYISVQPYADELMREYEEIKKDAVNWGVGVYPHTKSWFLKRFSNEDKPFDMERAKDEITNARLMTA